jgi:hypothetical protein
MADVAARADVEARERPAVGDRAAVRAMVVADSAEPEAAEPGRGTTT